MIYFAQPKGGGPIRIGASDNVDARRRSIGTWLPGGVEVVLEIEGSFLGEAVLHHCFNPIRIERDWFRSCEAMWEFIINAKRERPSWVPEHIGDAPKLDVRELVDEFGGPDACFTQLGYTNLVGFEQAIRGQTRNGYGISSRIVFHRLKRQGLLPPCISNLHPVGEPLSADDFLPIKEVAE